jgi:hypothetical protein
VKVETFTGSKEIPSDNPCKKFPVLVRITVAQRLLEEEMPRAGVDIVAVLDVSRRMRGEKLNHLKQAMKVVIDKLGVDDRLSIVSFNTYENRLMKLSYMSNNVRDVARLRINKLVAGGQNDMGAGLREGAQVQTCFQSIHGMHPDAYLISYNNLYNLCCYFNTHF